MKEIWKDIPSYEGIYKVSNKGKVKNIKFNRLMKPSATQGGILQVIISKDSKKKAINLPRLVYNSFAMTLEENMVITHRDRNPKNCSLENLIVFQDHSTLKSYLLLSNTIKSNAKKSNNE